MWLTDVGDVGREEEGEGWGVGMGDGSGVTTSLYVLIAANCAEGSRSLSFLNLRGIRLFRAPRRTARGVWISELSMQIVFVNGGSFDSSLIRSELDIQEFEPEAIVAGSIMISLVNSYTITLSSCEI